MAVMQICPKCQKQYQLGVNGAYNETRHRDECDQCAGARRDNQGHVWSKAERLHHYQNDDGTIEKVTRRQAFRRGGA